MKQIVRLFLAFSFLLLAFSCNKKQPTHNTVWNASGNNMVKVQSHDSNGNLIEYFMAYTLFNRLYNNGGYKAVNNYFYHNRPAFDRSYKNYRHQYSYSKSPKRVVNPIINKNYKKTAVRSIKNSTPGITAPSKKSFFSSFRRSSPSYKSSSTGSSFRSSSSSFRSSSASRSSSSFRSSRR